MAKALARYREHNDLVPRPARLLEFRLAGGWAPLCAFLGKDVPDVPFPRFNEGAQFEQMGPSVPTMHWASFKRIYGRPILAVAVAAARYQGMFQG